MKDLKQLITEYLESAKMMQIATCIDDQPWACTVYFAFDEELNLYWLSLPATRHSQEIERNSNVAGTIVLPHTPGDDVRGIQFEGTAEELSDSEIREFSKYYEIRFDVENLGKDIIVGKNNHKLYRIEPSLFVLFDQVNFPKDPRQEFSLI